MRTDHSMKSKSSWSKSAVGKWLNRKSNSEKFFHSSGGTAITDTADRRKSFSDQDNYGDDDDFSGWLKHSTNGLKQSELKEKERGPMTDPLNLRMFVGTWNVGGKSPNESLDLRNWLTSTSPADIYVIGFQEIVPLNAGNVLGPEDSGPAGKWVSLIHEALNNKNIDDEDDKKRRWLYCQVACKQMVGIFLSVWVRHPHCAHLTNLNISCVGRGIMGYLGNKGSISISMTLLKATFCFVCTHLASGVKSGDELRRNLDVSEILKRTKFYNSSSTFIKSVKLVPPPQSILEHDNVIWLGDLNYRLAADYDHIHHLLINNNWQTLLEKDQLRKEQKGGGIFEGWNEGSIYFAPTYKYLTNSDQYVAQTSKEKRRTPAWCDRILWKGEEVNQMWYVRGESKFSDHRPVSSMFSLQVDLTSSSSITSVPRSSCSQLKPLTSTCCAAKIQAEEQLMLLTRTQSCIATATRLLT